jgi:hypothetical protein
VRRDYWEALGAGEKIILKWAFSYLKFLLKAKDLTF